MIWIVVAIVFVLIVAVLLYFFPLVLVCGTSMCPTFNDGDLIVGSRLLKSIEVGEVYIFNPPVGEKYVIKRLTRISEATGSLFFEGDNADFSFDSRNYGYIKPEKVVAKYLFTLKKGV
jgi:signal peptidase I